MKRLLLTAVTCILLFSCSQNQKKIERKNEPDIYNVESDDKKMNDAISLANTTIKRFDTALTSGDTTLNTFSLKMRFDTPNGGEHIWMTNITLKDGKYFGEVGNLPDITKEVKLGQVVEIPKDKISDWMYIDKGKLKGGYTIRVIRDGMSEAEKKKFDQEMGMIIE